MPFAGDIAQWERLSGSREEYQAFLYMDDKLESFGYETKLVLHDAYICLPVSAELTVNGVEIPAQIHSMVPSTCPEGVRGDIVYLTPEEMEKEKKQAHKKGSYKYNKVEQEILPTRGSGQAERQACRERQPDALLRAEARTHFTGKGRKAERNEGMPAAENTLV